MAYEEAIAVVEEVVEPACARLGLKPVRADSLSRAGEITEQVFRRLRDDDLVIADLTGANANVMYELGLRHAVDKLTVQIGEYGRLPFDINVIRTVQFSRSQTGLINARNELAEILEAGLAGDYDPVTATRVWTYDTENASASALGEPEAATATEAAGEDGRGFIDIMVEAEEMQGELPKRTEAIGNRIAELGELAEASSEEVARADAAGKGMKGRFAILARYSEGLDGIAARLEDDVESYESALSRVSDGNIEMIKRLEEDPGLLDQPGGERNFAMILRRTAQTTRGTLSSLAEMVETVNANAKLSRVLKGPSQRLVAALDRFVDATGVVDEWDRRLQALGVEVPPEDWEPALDDEPVDAPGSAMPGPETGGDEGGSQSLPST